MAEHNIQADTSGREDSSSEDEVNENDEPVETLVSGRQRRTTAGNRLSSLLDQEAADDEVSLLFAEQEDDVEFEDPDAVEASDEDDESSSDEEDTGPPAADGVEKLDGEEQLKREERAARLARKRRADKTLVPSQTARKKAKMETAKDIAQAAQRQRKKSDRASWLPEAESAATRTSSRTLSVQNKQKTMASMRENEDRRIKQLATMETQRRKSSENRRPMTQAERMAEAVTTERLNSRSLNVWESAENERLKKQKARLEALQNRTLEGPVIRWHSGTAKWVDGKFKHIGKRRKVEEVVEMATIDVTPENISTSASQPSITVTDSVSLVNAGFGVSTTTQPGSPQATRHTPEPQPSGEQARRPHKDSIGFLAGIDYYASLPESFQRNDTATPSLLLPSAVQQHHHTVFQGDPHHNEPVQLLKEGEPLKPELRDAVGFATTVSQPQEVTQPRVEYACRNLVTLVNFDTAAIRDKDVQRRILFDWKATKMVKPTQPICAITSAPAKYQDPVTGLPYANLEAYRSIRRLLQGGSVWSDLLGAWVGEKQQDGRVAAKGVPEEFLSLDRSPNKKKAIRKLSTEMLGSVEG